MNIFEKFTKIKVGGHRVDIELPDLIDNGKTNGLCIYRTDKIQLARWSFSHRKRKDFVIIPFMSLVATFIHETEHAIDNVFNGRSQTEKQTDHMSEGWFQVLVDNTDMFIELLQEIKKHKGE